jgi:hypothetical protein
MELMEGTGYQTADTGLLDARQITPAAMKVNGSK